MCIFTISLQIKVRKQNFKRKSFIIVFIDKFEYHRLSAFFFDQQAIRFATFQQFLTVAI
jgi:hypothetical protein